MKIKKSFKNCIKLFLFFIKLYKNKKAQTIILDIPKLVSNQTIEFGFMTTFIIFQRSNIVKTQKNNDKYAKNQTTHILANDITHKIHMINKSAVNFILKANPDINHIIKIYIIDSFLSFFNKKKYLKRKYSATTLTKNNHSSTFKSFVV